MASEQPNANTPERNAATHVARVLQNAGHTAYFAGGCVRDALMGADPKDYDVATNATPNQVQAIFPKSAAVGAAFGVVIVYTSLLVPDMILAESFISFLGLGISEPYTSLGALIAEGAGTMAYGTLWQLLFPLFFYVTIIMCMFFIGDGVRDALDPKDR